jgi:hypothetical protein
MRFNIHINNKFYKVIDLGNKTKYNPKEITDMIQRDKDNGLLKDFNVDERFAIHIEKVD